MRTALGCPEALGPTKRQALGGGAVEPRTISVRARQGGTPYFDVQGRLYMYGSLEHSEFFVAKAQTRRERGSSELQLVVTG